MKRQKFLKLLLAAIAIVTMSVGFTACISEDNPPSKTETVDVWLDRYDEKTVQLESGEFSRFTWKTTNEKVVTVVNDKLSAMGEGTAVVTGTKDECIVTLNVTVNDSGAKPRIVCEDVEVYKTTETVLKPALSYNGEILDVNVEFTATVEDQAFATYQGLNVTAIKEGQTQLTVSGTYKGLELEKTVILTVKPYSFIELEGDTDEFTLYNVKNSKLGYFEVPLRVVVKGEQIENPEIEYTAATDGIVTFDGNTVKAATEGTTCVTAKCGDNTVTFTVNVLPNYVEETFNNQASASYGTVYEAYTGEEAIGGRTEGLFKYVTGAFGEESYWSHRIENSKANLSCQDAYKEYGYRYFAFDLYVTQDARFLAPVGSDNDTFYAPLNEYFDVDGLKVISNGKITNKFVTGEWMTVVYDLRERIMIDASANNKYYLALNGQQLISYLDNIRYYLDDTFLPEVGVLEYEEKEGFVQANNDEFAFYHNANEELYKKSENQVGEVGGAYKLIGGEGDYKNNTLVVASSTGRTRADSIINLKEKGLYLTFDIYVEDAQSLYFAIDYGKTEVLVNIGKTDFEKIDWISLISNGKLLHLLKQGQWVTVSIEYEKMLEALNIESNSPVAIEFGVTQENEVVYLELLFEQFKKKGITVIVMSSNSVNRYVAPDVPEKHISMAKDLVDCAECGVLDAYAKKLQEKAKKYEFYYVDAYAKWKKLDEYGVDTTMLLCNRLNHPSRKMHGLFADLLFDCIEQNHLIVD